MLKRALLVATILCLGGVGGFVVAGATEHTTSTPVVVGRNLKYLSATKGAVANHHEEEGPHDVAIDGATLRFRVADGKQSVIDVRFAGSLPPPQGLQNLTLDILLDGVALTPSAISVKLQGTETVPLTLERTSALIPAGRHTVQVQLGIGSTDTGGGAFQIPWWTLVMDRSQA